MPAVPVDGQPTLHPERRGEFYPDSKKASLEDVGEEIEEKIVHHQPNKPIPPFINPHEETQAAKRIEPTNTSDPETQIGRLRISGLDQIGSVIGDAINSLYSQRTLSGQPAIGPVSYAEASQSLARSMGIQPIPGHPGTMGDISGLTMFMNRAVSLGLGGEQAASLLGLVQRNHDEIPPDLGKAFPKYLTDQRGLSPQEAQQQADGLLHTARIIPTALVAYGEVTMTPPPVVVKPITTPVAPQEATHA
ncbi:MAG: hypothetical protein F9K46_19005 [Anaerolineae bacterium]|nr:MAG: hypothetical protein F9K46_19005 [Anaerolineae bacterium]